LGKLQRSETDPREWQHWAVHDIQQKGRMDEAASRTRNAASAEADICVAQMLGIRCTAA